MLIYTAQPENYTDRFTGACTWKSSGFAEVGRSSYRPEDNGCEGRRSGICSSELHLTDYQRSRLTVSPDDNKDTHVFQTILKK